MSKMKKILKFVLVMIMITISTLVFCENNEAQAASSEHATFTFKTYDGKAYKDYVEYDFQKSNGFTFSEKEFTSAFGMYEFANSMFPTEWYTVASNSSQSWGSTNMKDYTIEQIQAAIDSAPTKPTTEKDTFVPGELIAITFNVSLNFPYKMYSAMACLDIYDIVDEGTELAFYKDIDAGSLMTNIHVIGGRNYIKYGYAGDSGKYPDISDSDIATVVFKVKGSGNATIKVLAPPHASSGYTEYAVHDGSNLGNSPTYAQNNVSKFTIINKNITIQGASSNTTLKSLIVDSTPFSLEDQTTETVSGDQYSIIQAPNSFGVSNGSFIISGTGEDNAKITEVRYAKTKENALNGTSATSGSTGYTLNVSDSTTYPTGESLWAAITVTASDSVTTQTYLVEIPIRKSSDATLSSVTVTYNESTLIGNISNNNNITFASNFDYNEAISFSITPTANDTQIQNISVRTTAESTSGTDVSSGSSYNGSFTFSYEEVTVTRYIVVTAQDGTTKTYTLTFKRNAADDDCNLEGLVVTGNGNSVELAASFNPTTLNYTLNITSDVTRILINPTFGSLKMCTVNEVAANSGNNSSIDAPDGGFTNGTTIKIKVTAQNRSRSKEYTLTINVISSDTTMISNPLFKKGGIDLTTAYDDSTKTYTVTGLAYGGTDFTVRPYLRAGQSAKIFVNEYGQYALSSSTDTVIPYLDNSYINSTQTYSLIVTSEAGTSQTYTVVVKRADASTDTSLDSVSVVHGNVTQQGSIDEDSYTVTLPSVFIYHPTPGYRVTAKKGESVQTIAISNISNPTTNSSGEYMGTFGDGVLEITILIYIKITAQNPACSQEYTLTLVRAAADTNNRLENLSITTNTGAPVGVWDGDEQLYRVNGNVPYSTLSVTATATLNNSLATLKINNVERTSFTQSYSSSNVETKTFTIVVTSQSGVDNIITVEVSRDAADNNTKFAIVANVVNGADIQMGTSGSRTQNIVNLPYEVTRVTFKISPEASTTKIFINNVDYTETYYVYSFPITPEEYSGEITISIKTQSNQINNGATTHTIVFVRDAAENDIELNNGSFVISDSASNEYDPASSSGNTYSYLIPQAIAGNNFYIGAAPRSGKSKIYIATDYDHISSLNSMTEYRIETSYPIGGTIYLVVLSESGLLRPEVAFYRKVYTINTAYTDTRSTDTKVNNIVPTSGTIEFSQSQTTYTINVPYSVSDIGFIITLNDPTARLRSTVSTDTAINGTSAYNDLTGENRVRLSEGANTIYIQSEAQNDEFKGTIYIINVNREAASTNDYIESVTLNGYDLATINAGVNSLRFNPQLNSIDIALPRTTQSVYFTFNISSKASYTIRFDGNNLQSGSDIRVQQNYRVNGLATGARNVITIEVKSEKNVADNTGGNIYSFYVYTVDQNYSVNDILLFSQEDGPEILNVDGQSFIFDKNSLEQTLFTVPFVTSTAFAHVELGNDFMVLSGAGLKSLSASANTLWTIEVKSEYASLNPNITDQKITYKIRVYRNPADTDNTLSSLEVYIDGVNRIANFNPNTSTYSIENIPENTTLADFRATTNSSLARIISGVGNQTLSLIEHSSQTFKVIVESEAGVTKPYTIIISVKEIVLDGNYEISDIVGEGNDGVDYINYSSSTLTYTVNLPATCEYLSITATPSVSTSTISIKTGSQAAEEINRKRVNVSAGSSVTVLIFCKAENGTENPNRYEITINRAAYNTDATLSNLKVNGTTIDGFSSTVREYTINVLNSVETALVVPTPSQITTIISHNDASSPKNLAIGSNRITVTTLAEDGQTSLVYIINIVKDDVMTLDDLKITDKDDSTNTNLIRFDSETNSYSVPNIPYSTSGLNISAVTSGEYVNVRISNNGSIVSNTSNGTVNLIEGTNRIVIEVETESGEITEYIINVERKTGLTDNFILSYIDENNSPLQGLQNSETSYTYVLGRNHIVFNPTITVSNGATYKMPTATSLNIGRNEFTITVTSETGVDRVYTFTVYKNETIFDIDDIEVLVARNGADLVGINGTGTVDYLKETSAYSLTVSHSIQNFFLNIVKEGQYSTIYVNGEVFTNAGIYALADGTNTFTIYAVSEYGMANSSAISSQTSPTYTITIIREAANGDASLSDLKIMSGDTDLLLGPNASSKFDPDTLSYTIQNVGDITSIRINATTNHESATIISGTGVQTLEQLSDATGQIKGYVFSYSVKVRAEDGTEREYKINISRGPIALNEDNKIGYIVVKDSNGKVYLGQSNFNSTTLSYEYDLPFSVQSYNIEIVKATSVSPAVSFGTGQFTVNSSNYGTQKTHNVYLTSESGVKGTEYEIVINISEPSSDNKLNDIKINGVSIPNFDPNITSYNLGTYPNATDKLDVTYIQSDSKSSVTVNNPKPLLVGQNTISIAVTAEDGTTKIYNMTVLRDYPLPYLTNLEGVGEQLLDESDKATIFDRNKYTYHFVVTFLVLQMNFNASVDNTSHSVVCSNATYKTDQSTGNTRVFNAILNEGTNTFTFVVTSIEGKAQTYTVIVQRRGASSTNTNVDVNQPIKIENLPDFTDDFSNLVTTYGPYNVPFSVTDVGEVKLVLENGAATYEVYNTKLAVGLNKVVILITAEDGITTRAIVINVERSDMEVSINEDAYDEFKPEATNKNNTYLIDLGDKRASAINDYSKFLNISDEDKEAANIEILSDITREDCSEVVIRVTDVNGSSSQTYTFQLASTSINAGGQGISWYVWLVLGIVVILLIIILICVNRDKYGSILKKRKRANS